MVDPAQTRNILVQELAVRAKGEGQNRRARNGRVIRCRRSVAGRNSVDRALQALRNRDRPISDLLERLVETAEEGDVHVAVGLGAVGVGDADGLAGRAGAEGERGEGLEGQGGVG